MLAIAIFVGRLPRPIGEEIIAVMTVIAKEALFPEIRARSNVSAPVYHTCLESHGVKFLNHSWSLRLLFIFYTLILISSQMKRGEFWIGA